MSELQQEECFHNDEKMPDIEDFELLEDEGIHKRIALKCFCWECGKHFEMIIGVPKTIEKEGQL